MASVLPSSSQQPPVPVKFIIDFIPLVADGASPPPTGGIQTLAPDYVPLSPSPDRMETVTRLTSDLLAAEYLRTIQTIIDSPLHKAGMVGNVYVNFMGGNWYEVVMSYAHEFEDMTERRFRGILDALLDARPSFNIVMAESLFRAVPNFSTLLDSFPENTHIIDCVSGQGFQGARGCSSFIQDISDNHTHVFAVGQLRDEVANRVSDTIRVSAYSLEPYICLSSVCHHLARKWNMH